MKKLILLLLILPFFFACTDDTSSSSEPEPAPEPKPIEKVGCSVDDDCDTAAGEICKNGECVVQSLCGNGVIDLGEACDDGNRQDGDGCSCNCKIEFTECATVDDCTNYQNPVCQEGRCYSNAD